MNKNAVINSLILLPFIWLFSGMLVIKSGDKTMIAMILVSVIVTLVSQGLESVKHNLRHDKTLWVVLALTGYALFSYYYHGLSSRELRALLGASLFLLCCPRELLTSRLLRRLALVGAVCSFSFSVYYGQYLHISRGAWPINAIPQATLSASVGIIALVHLIKHQNKMDLLLSGASLLLCLAAILLSQTRGIWLGFATATSFILLLHLRTRKINWKYLVAGMAIIFAAGFTLRPQLEQRIQQTQNEIKKISAGNLSSSIGLRLQMWKLGPDMLTNDWLLGAGDSHAQKFDELYKQGFVSDALVHLDPAHYHNQYLDRLIKNGLIGLVLFLCLFTAPLAQLRRLPPVKRYMIIGLVVVYAIAALTDVPFNHGQTIFMYLLLACSLTSEAKIEQ